MDMSAAAVGLSVLGVVLAAVSLVLHKVAPMTKNKMDDKFRDGVDFVKDKVVPVASAMLPKSEPVAKPVTGFEQPGASVRDHRAK